MILHRTAKTVSHECFLITSWQYLANTNTNANKKEQEEKLQRIFTRKNFTWYEEGENTNNRVTISSRMGMSFHVHACAHTRAHAHAHAHTCTYTRSHARARAVVQSDQPTPIPTNRPSNIAGGWIELRMRARERDPWAYLPTQQGRRKSILIHNFHACLLLLEPLMYPRFVDFETKLRVAD